MSGDMESMDGSPDFFHEAMQEIGAGEAGVGNFLYPERERAMPKKKTFRHKARGPRCCYIQRGVMSLL